MAFLARECGWDARYIAETMTMDQVNRYYEIVYRQKLRDLKMQTISTLKAVGYAFGGVKQKDFMDFVESLEKTERKLDFDEVKRAGIPVEDN